MNVAPTIKALTVGGLILISSLGYGGANPAHPMVLNCSGLHTEMTGFDPSNIIVSISLPIDRSSMAYGSMESGEGVDDLGVFWEGAIEVSKVHSSSGNKFIGQHKLYITQLPDKENGLVGVFFLDSYPSTIYVKYWDKEKPFVMHDTHWRQIIKGSCK